MKTAAKAAGCPVTTQGSPGLRHRHRGLGCRGPWGGLGLDLYRQRRDGDGQLRHTDGPGGGPDSVDLCDRLDITATRPGRAAEERVRVFPQAPERGGGDFCETNQTGDGPAVWPAGPGAADHRLWHCLFHPGRAGDLPISSLPYVVSLLTPLSVGTATICLHGVLILLQLLILRRRYDPVQLLQLPVALVFGYLTDLGVWVIQGIPVPSLWGAVAAVPGGGVPGGRRGGPGSGGRGGDPGPGRGSCWRCAG